jgi:GNAT superfamily N-acetyltransferase
MQSLVSVRVMRTSDISAGLRLCRASGWNQLAPDWERFLAFNPGGCRVAVDESGEVIGSVATLRFGGAFAWVAMVLIDPNHRRAGVGTRLLEEALLLLADVATVRLDATPAGMHVYELAGFREEYRLQRMQRDAVSMLEAPPAEDEGMSHVAVRPMTEHDLDEVFARDEYVFGADRRRVLDSFRRQMPSYAWVAVGPDSSRALPASIVGYAFGRPGYLFEHLGPVVARDEDAARRLVTTCLTAHPDRSFIVDVPVRRSWVNWLESRQFVLQRPFIRMYRGKRNYQDRPEEVFAIAGPEFA